jgi:hypothetical protein
MATKNTPATTKTATIPVRLNLLVQIDPARWTADAPAVDADVIAKALAGAGIPEETAKAMAATMTAAPEVTGPQAVRVAVRDYILTAVKQLEKLVAAGATVVDADRQPKPAR